MPPVVTPVVIAVMRDVAADCAAPKVILDKLTATSKSKTKLNFMNTVEGRKILRGNGAHVLSLDTNNVGSCMLCGARTQRFCMTCSQAAVFQNNEKVQFYVCTTPSRAAVGQHLNISTCHQMMHNADKLVFDATDRSASPKSI